jgi:hypothetical protein
MRYVIFGIIALLFLKAGWNKIEKSTIKLPGVDTSKWNFDFATTTPGMAIDSLLGAGWANWVLLAFAILSVIWLINWGRSLAGGKSSGSGGLVGMSVIMALGLIIALGVKGYVEKPQSTNAPVTFQGSQVGVVKTVTIGIHDTISFRFPQADARITGADRTYSICPRASVRKDGFDRPVLFETTGSGNVIQIMSESKKDLTDDMRDRIRVDIEFTLVNYPLTRVSDKCKRIVW